MHLPTLLVSTKTEKMAKEINEVKPTEKKAKSAREERWDAYVQAYAISNPVKFASKKERGEFDTIPESFK